MDFSLSQQPVSLCRSSRSWRQRSGAAISRFAAIVVGCALAFLGSGAEAQSDSPPAEKDAVAITTADPDILPGHLELIVKPLTQDELLVEANGWRDLVKESVQDIVELRLAIKENEGSADALPALNERKIKLVEKFNLVLDEYAAKGGDDKPFRQYVAALAGIGIELKDSSAIWATAKGWLQSEEGGKRWAWNLAKFLTILVAFYFAASFISNLVIRAANRFGKGSKLLANFLGRFVKHCLMVIGFIVALAALEVDITPMLAAIGAAGFVIGFALQGTLSNFASGLLILAYRPFDVGDSVEAGGVSGVVDSVSLVSTHIRTFDNKMLIVPNNDVWGGAITNASTSNTRRVDMVFGIGYDDDIELATRILNQLVNDHELVLDDPATTIQLNELADSSVNFICRPWTKTGDYWTVYWDITRAVKLAFDSNGLSIPYPQRDVHVFNESPTTEA